MKVAEEGASARGLTACGNPACRRSIRVGTHCCPPCIEADNHRAEVIEHTETCTARHRVRVSHQVWPPSPGPVGRG